MKRIKQFFHWMNDKLESIPERDRNAREWILGLLIVTSISASIYALGNPIKDAALYHFLNISKWVLVNAALFSSITYVLAALFSFINLPLPRLALAGVIYTIIANTTILKAENSGTFFSYTIGPAYSLVTAGIIALAILLFKYKRRVAASMIILLLFIGFFVGKKLLNPEGFAIYQEGSVHVNLLPDASEEGPYAYRFLTYGSGSDIQRDWFGAEVDITTPSVDSSHFISKWGKERTKFWGFTEKNLPLNGRLWLPEGEGPFPVVLMVHGNHTMEYLSTSGYDYLGEQLASYGILAISVDEDFINYSNIFGSPNRNYELRAWMMMQHLAELQRLNEAEASLLQGKIDFDRVGLMGHSRGGQAVAMVADYERFFTAEEDADLREAMEDVRIQGIVAIAPTDRSINNERAYLKDVSYLLIHGARDADVNDFSNEKQFYRTSFSPGSNHFKASVYVERANHTQFNSDWGRMDLSVPRGLFLNRSQMFSAEEQRDLAKFYMTAFFERVLHGDQTYDLFFENPHYAKDDLPDTALVTKYQPASYRVIESFSEENTYEKASGFSSIERVTPEHRRGSKRMRDALKLSWEGTASLGLDVTGIDLSPYRKLVLTMANAQEKSQALPFISVEFIMEDGNRKKVNFTNELPLPPVIKTDFTHLGLFDRFFRGDRYKNSWEPVFQSFPIDLPKGEKIEGLLIQFADDEGQVLIQEVGIY